MRPLDPHQITSIIQLKGLLSTFLKGFEPRLQQQEMLGNVIDAYNKSEIALIEAGTGTGKSIAYLIPAILWAAKQKERTVISTNTINLQEQLIEKDIPLLLRALNINLKAVLVKGMNNYLCLRKLKEAQEELLFLPKQEAEEIQKIDECQQTMQKGSRSEFPFMPSSNTWELVGAESDTCNHTTCPHYQQCYFFKARREANDAQILVANHHLLFADLAIRADTQNYQNPAILPQYSRIILDEAHHIEDIATEYFASRITRIEIGRILARLASERHHVSHGKLPLLKQKLTEHYGKKPPQSQSSLSSVMNRLNVLLPGEKRDLLQVVGEMFLAFYEFVRDANPSNEEITENKLRLLPEHHKSQGWKNEISPRVQQLLTSVKRYVTSLHGLEIDLQGLKDEKLNEITQGIRFDVTALADRLANACSTLEAFISEKEDTSRVRWIESEEWKTFPNIHLIDAKLNIAKILVDFLFSKFPTIILCSATLTTNQKFDFVRSRLGLTKELLPTKKITENSYDSPFNYKQQALLAVPKDIPSPDHPNFTREASEKIWQSISASHGNAFVLFTSYNMLLACYKLLTDRLHAGRFHVFKQGDDTRRSLLNKFKTTDRSVLFGTDSFWEGVDVAGEALRCVILVKLPFKVPKEPLIQARSEAISSNGGNPFMEYFIPNAIVKFKQGFGRLIRHKRDRGCIVCLDSRLMTKSYGKLFINSLPDCQKIFESDDLFQQSMIDFYRTSYHLIKKP